MKFLIDVCLGRVVENALVTSLECDFKCIRDIDPRMADDEIIRIAKQENRIIITSDKDFGELVYKRGLAHQGVLLLRIDELTVQQRISVISQIITEHGAMLNGHFCVFQKDLLRVR
jgi:predicted nuclease of predicted toxin-antitoxin system